MGIYLAKPSTDISLEAGADDALAFAVGEMQVMPYSTFVLLVPIIRDILLETTFIKHGVYVKPYFNGRKTDSFKQYVYHFVF